MNQTRLTVYALYLECVEKLLTQSCLMKEQRITSPVEYYSLLNIIFYILIFSFMPQNVYRTGSFQVRYCRDFSIDNVTETSRIQCVPMANIECQPFCCSFKHRKSMENSWSTCKRIAKMFRKYTRIKEFQSQAKMNQLVAFELVSIRNESHKNYN